MIEQQQMLAEWITADKLRLKKDNVRILKQIETKTLVEKMCHSIVRISLSPIPLTTEAGRLGKSVLLGIEDLTIDEGIINRSRIEVGLQLLRILINHKIIQYYRLKDEKYQYVVDALNEEFVNAIFWKIPPKDIPEHTQPSYSQPEPRSSFADEAQGQLVAKIRYDNVKKYYKSKMPKVYEVVNKLQSQAYRVNTDVLDIVNQFQDNEIFTLIEKRKKLYAKGFDSSIIYDKITGVKRENSMVLHKAKDIGDRAFWTYVYLDFRGRKYYSTHWMNPQGSKLAKSLYYFDNTAELGLSGLFFLKFQVANTWGEDKLSIDDRVQFVDDNIDTLLDIGKDPVNNKRWLDADSPFEFLAAIVELYKAMQLDDPTKFRSGLPIALDATCSGLQWLSALSQDKVAGALCNLTDNKELGDYYNFIADYAWEHKDLPPVWKDKYKHRRKIVKRSCMVKHYSAGAKTMGTHIWRDFGDKYDDVTKEDCLELGVLIYKLCLSKVKGPAEVMDLLVKLGQEEAKSGKDLELTMPVDDFPFIQSYRGSSKDRIQFTIDKKRLQLTYISAYNTWIKTKEVITGSSPNVIHALDAQLVSRLMLDIDYQVIPIHDSFSTRPADVGRLYEDLRIAFVNIIKQDLLMDLFSQVDRENLLADFKTGHLNVNHIIDNEYTFS